MPRPLVGYFSRHYIAGEKLEDAVRVVRELMDEGACVTIDLLGEEVTSLHQAEEAVQTYSGVLEAIKEHRLDANVSLKPTHMGLKLDREACFANVRELVDRARSLSNFVRIDMEDSSCVDDTLRLFGRLRRDFDNVGTVLQAYNRRTMGDINQLLPLSPNLRICKGIYVEPRQLAYKDPEIIRQSYSYSIEKLLENRCYVGIATHDERLVFDALRTIDRLKLDPTEYEFQMLLGVDPQLRRIILDHGHRLRVYVPFGKSWFAYSTRRLKENPDMVGHVLGQMWRRFREN